MTATRRLWIDGHARWADARAATRPAPTLLAANERRRAPDGVLIALEVAQRAVQASGHEAATLASVFSSAHGDLAIVEALAQTLAGDPSLLSPLRFHHSVHNAASGYWAIGAGSHAPSTALSAFDHSFAAGLLEAACQVEAEAAPVLLVGVDTEARGALAAINRSRGLLGVALVLSPRPGPASRWSLDWRLRPGHADPPPVPPALADLAANAMADALPLSAALDGRAAVAMVLPLGPQLALELSLQPL